MYYQVEFTIDSFQFWSGAKDTIKDIENADLMDELESLICEVFECSDDVTDTKINDFVWFEREYIYERLGLDENGELPED